MSIKILAYTYTTFLGRKNISKPYKEDRALNPTFLTGYTFIRCCISTLRWSLLTG
jgi:hypothetical protein